MKNWTLCAIIGTGIVVVGLGLGLGLGQAYGEGVRGDFSENNGIFFVSKTHL